MSKDDIGSRSEIEELKQRLLAAEKERDEQRQAADALRQEVATLRSEMVSLFVSIPSPAIGFARPSSHPGFAYGRRIMMG
jgi:hypothetical protein